MKFAINLPIVAEFADPRLLVRMGQEAEAAGWDGVFTWDTLLLDEVWRPPVVDPWVVLSGIAATTRRVRIGTMIAHLARRDPPKVAREVATLDILSEGRMTLGVGLGYNASADFKALGHNPNDRDRANRLDECLEIITGLWSGEPFSYSGSYYHIADTTFTPTPVQRPRVPIWTAGYWPNKRPFRVRGSRWDGICPAEVERQAGAAEGDFRIVATSPARVAEIRAYVMRHRRAATPLDMVISRGLHERSDDVVGLVEAYAAAGVTWLLRDMLPWEVSVEEGWRIIRGGPPRV